MLLGAVLLHHSLIAGWLEARLGLNEMSRPLIVEGAGREGAGSKGGKVGQVHVVASWLRGLGEKVELFLNDMNP